MILQHVLADLKPRLASLILHRTWVINDSDFRIPVKLEAEAGAEFGATASSSNTKRGSVDVHRGGD
jgi:hypothetical protein